jgi:hypothetical protein
MRPVKYKDQVWQHQYHQEEPTKPILLHIIIVLACDIEHTNVNSYGGNLEREVLHAVETRTEVRFEMYLHK